MKSIAPFILFLFLFLSVQISSQHLTRKLYVEFTSTIVNDDLPAFKEKLQSTYPDFDIALSKLCDEYRLVPIMPLHTLNELDKKAAAISKPSKAIQELRSTFRLDIPKADDALLDQVVLNIKALDKVKGCYFSSAKMQPPPYDIAPVTTDFFPMQTYIGPNPGVNMQYAWSMGITGTNINVRDIEYGVNINHEELNQKNVFVTPGVTISSIITTQYTEHGTAAIGIIMSDKGNYGVSGMQHGINEMILFPEYTDEYGYDRVYAISTAISQSAVGDIIMYEMQTSGQDNEYVPAEFEYPVWQLTKAATDAGIVIVAAAGNGNQNLDDPYYDEYNGRGNSGAIIVGAGSPNTSHTRLYFSTYGSRVDVQGWGNNVIAPGYGTDFQFGGDFNQNYIYFSGTSSATPIVASCAIALQSYYFGLTGNYLTCQQINTILKQTGIPQGSPSTGHIGPLPNMQGAIGAIASVGISNINQQPFLIYPNPATDQLYISPNQTYTIEKIELINTIGQIVYTNEFDINQPIDISSFKPGMYFMTISGKEGTFTQKIIKE